MTTRRCAIYTRISVAREASVSIDRQVEAGEQYAAARGWHVAAVFRDDGVSATHNRPEQRAGWRALLDSPETFDSVVIWKLDRLARRVLDFHLANEALKKRGVGLVAVENSIDMTTADGRMIAGVLATFAEYEADAISARVKDARDYLLREGRVVGGTLPYGWRSVPNPTGEGYVLAHDPDRIDYVRGMVERVQLGGSVYSVVRWLDADGVPLPCNAQTRRKAGGWSYSTVERLLRNPVLCGMTSFNPGNKTQVRGLEVRRGSDGLPVVDPSVAIMSVAEWRAMVLGLDERDSAQSLPVAMRSQTSALLSGLVYCGEPHEGEGPRMHRGTIQGRHGYYCPTCHQAISNFESVVVGEFLRQKGERVRWSVVEEVYEGGAAVLPEIEHRLAELLATLQRTDDDDEADRLTGQIGALRTMRREARAAAPRVVARYVRHTKHGTVEEAAEDTRMFGEDWAAAETVEDRRAVLDDALARITVRRGGSGRRTEAQLLARLTFDWKVPEDLGPVEQLAE